MSDTAMDEPCDDDFDEYSDIELDETTAHLLDQDLDDFENALPLDAFPFGSEDYCKNFKRALYIETKQRTGYSAFPWQLDVALYCHLGRDVFLLAGTGSGKTLAFIMLCFLDPSWRIFLISPLNALANAQVEQFKEWGLKAVAVNATTKYKELYTDILTGKYQIVISSIEAFTDTTRLLPIIKSPELASKGRQCVVIDEAHCIVKWGQNFRPQYSTIGNLRLLLTAETPFIAATATANKPMRQAIKESLRFNESAFEVNLGNRRANLALSVHRLKNASASIGELLEYFPSKTDLPGYSLIFVDNRKLGHTILHMLRQHVVPELRGAIQLYHACRSEFDKKVIAAGFEREDGFKVLVCTEAVALGVNFRKSNLVIQVLTPEEIEILLQRMGRTGREKGSQAEGVLMAQDSVFEDSKAGQKRLLNTIKKEDEPKKTTEKQAKATADKLVRQAAKDKTELARRVPKQFSAAILKFVNAPGCRVEVLDQEFDNPPRPAGELCLCDVCRRARGEPTLRERMAIERGEHAVETQNQLPVDQDEDQSGDETAPETALETAKKAPSTRKYRPVKQREPYILAVNNWIDFKFRSAECQWWDIDKSWILSEKQVKSIAMHPGMTSVEDLNKLKPAWVHYERWGLELFAIIQEVTRQIEDKKQQAEEERKRLATEKRQAEEERYRAAAEARRQEEMAQREPLETTMQDQHAAFTQDGPASALVGTPAPATESRGSKPPPKKRVRLPKDASEEQKTAHKARMAAEKAAKDKVRHEKKRSKDLIKKEPAESFLQTPGAGPSNHLGDQSLESLETVSGSASAGRSGPPPTLEVKQELVDQTDLLYRSTTYATPSSSTTPLRIQPHHRIAFPTPSTPAVTSDSAAHYTWTPGPAPANQLLTPRSAARNNPPMPAPVVESPSTHPRARPRPRMRVPSPDQPSNPSPSR